MNLKTVIVWVGAAALVALGYRAWGWAGVGLAAGGGLMWLLLHFTRLMHVLKRAADRPIGFVDSAVMLNARLKPGLNLLRVVGLTRSLGEQLSGQDEQPERFRWRDAYDASVTCEFQDGRLVRWELQRPIPDAGMPAAPAP